MGKTPENSKISATDTIKEAQHTVLEQKTVKTDSPPMYNVILLNDDYTPMDFVIVVLREFFHKSAEQASQIMMHTHVDGQGHCGLFTREVAETKMMHVINAARESGHPLKCIISKES